HLAVDLDPGFLLERPDGLLDIVAKVAVNVSGVLPHLVQTLLQPPNVSAGAVLPHDAGADFVLRVRVAELRSTATRRRRGTTGRSWLLASTDCLRDLTNTGGPGVDLKVHLVLAATVVPAPADNSTEIRQNLLDLANLRPRERTRLAQRVPRSVQINRRARRMIRGRARATNRTLSVTPVSRPHQLLNLRVEPLREIHHDRRNVTLTDGNLPATRERIRRDQTSIVGELKPPVLRTSRHGNHLPFLACRAASVRASHSLQCRSVYPWLDSRIYVFSAVRG